MRGTKNSSRYLEFEKYIKRKLFELKVVESSRPQGEGTPLYGPYRFMCSPKGAGFFSHFGY